MAVDEELLYPPLTDAESSVDEDVSMMHAAPSLPTLEYSTTTTTTASSAAASATLSSAAAASAAPQATTRAPRAPGIVATLGGYGGRASSGTGGGLNNDEDDDGDARKKKAKTGMKREEKLAVQIVENPYRLFELIRNSLRAPNGPSTAERMLEEIQKSPQMRPGIWLPGFTRPQFLLMALHYLEAPPVLPVSLPTQRAGEAPAPGEELSALQQAAARGEFSNAPFVRLRADRRWEWIREGAAVFLPPLEQVFYFCAARGMTDMGSLTVQVPNLK